MIIDVLKVLEIIRNRRFLLFYINFKNFRFIKCKFIMFLASNYISYCDTLKISELLENQITKLINIVNNILL